jgi:hypothetical protein
MALFFPHGGAVPRRFNGHPSYPISRAAHVDELHGQPLSVIMTYDRAPAGRTGEALGLRFSLVNLTHMIIPLAFGTIGSALGLVTVFLANSALMLGGGYAHHRGAKKARRDHQIGPL